MAKDEILLRTELEIARTKTKIKELKKEIDGLDMRYTENKQKAVELEFQEQKLAKSKQLLAKRNKELSVSQSQLERSTGAATSAALELGRVISDAPYGIRGMANNVSQLVSQFSFMATSVDNATGKVVGFSGALKNFGRAIKANAVLLLIQGVISALDYFAGSTSKAEKEFNSFSDTVSKGFVKVAKIESLNNIMKDTNSTLSEQQEALDDLKKLGFDPANQSIDEFIENQKKLVVVNAGMKAIEGQLAEIYTKRLELFSKFRDEYANLLRIQKEGYGGEDISKAILEQLKLDKVELEKKEAELKKELQRLIKRSLDFDVDKLTKGNGKDKSALDITTKVFNLDSFDIKTKEFLSRQENVNKQIELSLAESEEEKLKIQEKYQLISLQRGKAVEIQKINDARALYEEKVKDEFNKEEDKYKKLLEKGKITQEQLTEWQIQASQEVIDKLDEADEKQINSVNKVIKSYDGLIELYEKLYGLRLKAIGAKGKKDEEKEIEDIHFYIEQYKQLVGGLTQFLDAEAQRQITIEQNKTNKLNEALNNRLLNENLSKDERAKIQNEIWQNDEALRKKQNEIKKKQFNTQKALNISMGIANTISAGIKASNETYGGPFAKIAAMTAVIGAGLAQVAIIARQKFQPEAASTPIRTAGGGGGGGGVGDRSFNFNLVGANQQNQLVNAIQSQFDRPLKAYVVSKDITNQQQLDANTKSTARFGG